MWESVPLRMYKVLERRITGNVRIEFAHTPKRHLVQFADLRVRGVAIKIKYSYAGFWETTRGRLERRLFTVEITENCVLRECCGESVSVTREKRGVSGNERKDSAYRLRAPPTKRDQVKIATSRFVNRWQTTKPPPEFRRGFLVVRSCYLSPHIHARDGRAVRADLASQSRSRSMIMKPWTITCSISSREKLPHSPSSLPRLT